MACYYNCGGGAMITSTEFCDAPRELLFTLCERLVAVNAIIEDKNSQHTDLRGVQDALLWVQERLST